jgi:hypothetical protein
VDALLMDGSIIHVRLVSARDKEALSALFSAHHHEVATPLLHGWYPDRS